MFLVKMGVNKTAARLVFSGGLMIYPLLRLGITESAAVGGCESAGCAARGELWEEAGSGAVS